MEVRQLLAGVAAEVWVADDGTQMETVTEDVVVQFSALEKGVHPVNWTVQVEGLGSVTFVGDRNLVVTDQGIGSGVDGTGVAFAMVLNDQEVLVKSMDLTFQGTSVSGVVGTAAGNPRNYFGSRIPLSEHVAVDRTLNQLDWGQNGGPAFLKSITVERLVTRPVVQAPSDSSTTSAASGLHNLQVSDLAWAAGRDDARGVLGVGDFLPGSNLYGVEFSPDGSLFVVSGQYGKASIVDSSMGQIQSVLAGHGSGVMDAAWMSDGSSLFTASYDHHVRQFSKDGTLLWDSGDLGQLAVGVDVTANGRQLLVRLHEVQPIVVDIATKEVRSFGSGLSLIGSLESLSDGGALLLQNDWAYKGQQNRVLVLIPETNAVVWHQDWPGRQITIAMADPSGQYVFTASDDGLVTMTDRLSNNTMMVRQAGSAAFTLGMDASGTVLLVGTQQGIEAYDVQEAMTGGAVVVLPTIAVPASRMSVAGTVLVANNTAAGAGTRTTIVDLGKNVPITVERLRAMEATTTHIADTSILDEILGDDSLSFLDETENLVESQTESLAAVPGTEEFVVARGFSVRIDGGKLWISLPLKESVVETRLGTFAVSNQGEGEALVLSRSDLQGLVDESRTGVVTIYADAGKTMPLYRASLLMDHWGTVSVSSAVPVPVRSGDLPDSVEQERASSLQVAKMEKNTMLLAVEAGVDAEVVIRGTWQDSVLDRGKVAASDRTEIVELSLNAANPSGVYEVVMTGTDGMDRAMTRIRWNQEAGQMTLVDERGLWVPGEDQQSLLEDAVEAMRLSMIDLGATGLYGEIQQQIMLAETAKSLPGIGLDIEALFRAKHPEWADPDTMHAKAVADSQTSNFSATQIYEGLLKTGLDQLGVVRNAYSVYSRMVGGLLKEAMSLLSKMRSGANEINLKQALAGRVAEFYPSVEMATLAPYRIIFPNAVQVLSAARDASGAVTQAFLRVKEDERLAGIALRKAQESGAYAGTGGTTDQPVSKDTILQNLAVILQSEGIGSPLERATVYGRLNGLTLQEIAAVALVTPDDVGVAIARITIQASAAQGALHGAAPIVYRLGETHLLMQIGNDQEFVGTTSLTVQPNGTSEIELVITEDKMVSFGLPGGPFRNVSLSISGDGLGETVYPSNHGQGHGNSVSLKLTPGTYHLRIKDEGGYSVVPPQTSVEISVHIQKYNSASIEGMISNANSSAVMPVRMRVAMFDPHTHDRIDPDLRDCLDPSKPVWVVVHGRNDRDDSGKMLELEKALTESGYQVVTIDWREAAHSAIQVEGEAWIQAVADWSYRALVSAGIKGENIRMGVHSWGALVGFEIAKHFKQTNGFGVDTFIALDPAIDPSLSTLYDASQVNFAEVSKKSTAFWSSIWGSKGRASTAQDTVELRSGDVSAEVIFTNQVLKHGMAVTAFANLVRLKRIDPSNPIAFQFSLSSVEASALPQRDGIDAWMEVDTYREFVGAGDSYDEYIDAVPHSMTCTNPDDDNSDVYFFNELKNLK